MKKLMKCTNCGEMFEAEAMREVDGNYYCEDCFNELFTVCAYCGRVVKNEDITLINNRCDDEQYVCKECLQRYCFRCDSCGNYYFDYHLWDTSAHSYTVSNLLLEAYPKGATLDDVFAYLIDTDAPIDFVNGANFYGIRPISESDNFSCSSMYTDETSGGITGDNENGYSLTDTADGAFYRYFLFSNKNGTDTGMPSQEDESVVKHSVQICAKNGDKTVSIGKYSTQEELVLFCFDEATAEIRDKDGKKVLGNYNKNDFYNVDIFFNNKDYAYSVYFGGKEIACGTLENTPVGYISYENGTAGGSMILKNVSTKVYALGTSMDTAIEELYGKATIIELRDITVLETEDGYEISVAAVFDNVTRKYTAPKIVYELYKNGELVKVSGENVTDEVLTASDEIMVESSEIDRKYPYGLLKADGLEIGSGDEIAVKAWLASGNSQEPIIAANTVSFTVE